MKTQIDVNCRHILMSLTLMVTTVIASASFAQVRPTDQLHEYLNPFRALSRETHLYREISDADAALENRLQLIENAKRSIIIDAAVFRMDDTGRAVLNALIKKAVSMKRLSYVRDEKTAPKTVMQDPVSGSPFQIRILVDYQTSGKTDLDRHIAKILMETGIEVRYFHVPVVGLFESYSSHRNMMIVDDQLCISSGEISNSYFSNSTQGRDLCLQGKITRAALKNFHAFWYLKDGTYEGHFAEIPKTPKAPDLTEGEILAKGPINLDKKLQSQRKLFADSEERARSLLSSNFELERKTQSRRYIGQGILNNTQWKVSNSVSLVSDLLGDKKSAERVSTGIVKSGTNKQIDAKCTSTMDLSLKNPTSQSDIMVCINDKGVNPPAMAEAPAKSVISKVDLTKGTLAEIQARYQFKPEKRDCVESNLDPFDPGAYMKDGPDKGICADTSDLRVPVVLDETADTITIANFRHARKFWIATINKNAIEEVYFQNGTFGSQPFFFTTAAHSQIRLVMNKKSPILLQEQRLGSKEVQYIDAFVISAEPYNVRNGIPKDEMRIITRFVSQLDRATDEMGYKIRKFTDQIEMNLSLAQRTHLLKTAIYRSISQGYTRYYTVWRASCAVEAIKTVVMAFPPKHGEEASAMITILNAIDPVIGPTTKVLKTLGLVDEESANYTLEDEYSSPIPFMNEMRKLTPDRREQKKLDLLLKDANNGVYDPASNLEFKFYTN